MDEAPTSTDEIARLEERIEHYVAVAESCRKFMLAAKAAIGAGCVVLAGTALDLWDGSPVLLLGALAAIIGGIVVSGSNASTRQHVLAAAAAAEAQRSGLIDRLSLRLVPAPDADRG